MASRRASHLARAALLWAAPGAFLDAQALDPWQDRTAATLRMHVEPITGPVATPCGIAWVPPATGPDDYFPARKTEIASALACVEAAARQGRATWAFWQYRGIDSTVMGGLAVTATGDYRMLHYDSYPPGRFDATPCPVPRLDPTAPYGIACAPAPAAHPRQLPR
jgi:hypothetical protein